MFSISSDSTKFATYESLSIPLKYMGGDGNVYYFNSIPSKIASTGTLHRSTRNQSKLKRCRDDRVFLQRQLNTRNKSLSNGGNPEEEETDKRINLILSKINQPACFTGIRNTRFNNTFQ